MENFSNICEKHLKSNYKKVPINSTTTLVNDYGSEVGLPKESTSYIKVDREYVEKYTLFFNELQEWKEVLNNPWQNGYQVRKRLVNNALNDIEGFFNKNNCESPVIKQLGMNLLRASKDQASVQAANISVPGVTSATKKSTYPELLYINTTGNARVEYGYLNAPIGWLPEKPKLLLKKSQSKYGKTMQHHQKGEVLTGVKVTVHGVVGKHSLREIIVSPFPDSNGSILFTLWREVGSMNLKNSWRKMIKNNSKGNLFLVECLYDDYKGLAYWHENQPSWISRSKLKAIHPNHPLLKIQPPKENCPKQPITAELIR